MAQTKKQTAYFCTYMNSADTRGEWRKSREYTSMQALLSKMLAYLEKYPRTTVTYQTRTVYSVEQP